jgi:hypothetical protein
MNSACRLSVGGQVGSSTGAFKSGSGHARCRRSGGQGFRLVSRSAVPTTKPRFDGFLLLLDCFVSYGVQQRRATGRSQLDTSAPAFLLLPAQGSPRLVWSRRVSVVSLDYHHHRQHRLCQPATNRPFLQNNPNSHHQGLPPPQPLQHPRQAGLIQQHRPDSPLQPHGIHHSSQSPYLSPHSSTHSVPQHHSPYVGSVPSLPSQHGADPNYFTAHPSPYSANSAAGSYASSGTPLSFFYLSCAT